MRSAEFLFALSLLSASVFLLSQSLPIRPDPPRALLPTVSNEGGSVAQTGDGVRMLRRADIVVIPVELAVTNRAELAYLRDRVAEAERQETDQGKGFVDGYIRRTNGDHFRSTNRIYESPNEL